MDNQMSPASSLAEATPGLCTTLPSFAAADPGSWQHLLDRARAADQAGVDRVMVTDRVVFGENLEAFARSELGGMAGGRQPTGPDGLWLDPLTVLSVVCGLTTRVRLATNILLAALRRPVVLAKMAATLDVLSGGRLDLGVGTGWQREEYQAAGLDFERRASCSITPWRCARPCGGIPLPGLIPRSCASSRSTACPSRPSPGACRSGSAAPSTSA